MLTFNQSLQQFHQHVILCRIASFRIFFCKNSRMATNLLQTGQCGQHMNLYSVKSFFFNKLRKLFTGRCGIRMIQVHAEFQIDGNGKRFRKQEAVQISTSFFMRRNIKGDTLRRKTSMFMPLAEHGIANIFLHKSIIRT